MILPAYQLSKYISYATDMKVERRQRKHKEEQWEGSMGERDGNGWKRSKYIMNSTLEVEVGRLWGQGLPKIQRKTLYPKCEQNNQIGFFILHIEIISNHSKRSYQQPLRKWYERHKKDTIWNMMVCTLRNIVLMRMQRNQKPLSIIGWSTKTIELWNSMAVPLNSNGRIILQSWVYVKIIKCGTFNGYLYVAFFVLIKYHFLINMVSGPPSGRLC